MRKKLKTKRVPLAKQLQRELSAITKRIEQATTEILHLHAQIVGVKADIDTMRDKVLAVNAVMTAQIAATLAAWEAQLGVMAKKNPGRSRG